MSSRDGSSTRERLIAAVRELLAAGPTAAFSLETIAARAGSSKATIYRYFPTRAALVAAAGGEAEEPGRRDRVLDAAMRVIPRLGLSRLTMESIAEEAGVSPPTLYWHFRGKDDLLLAVVERMADRFEGALAPGGPSPEPAAFLTAFATRAAREQSLHVDVLRTFVTEVGSRPELAAAVYDRLVSRIWGAMAAYFAAKADSGAFRPGHPLLRVVALAGMVTFYSLARRNFGERIDLPSADEAAAEFVRIFLEGVSDGGDSGGPGPSTQ